MRKFNVNVNGNNNTVIVVEHNREIINSADNIIDIGPESGNNGGEIIYTGNVLGILESSRSITGKYLKNKKILPNVTKEIKDFYEINGISINNIKNLNLKIPLNLLICITGVSGSGKSSLIRYLFKNDKSFIKIGKENVGVNSRSNVATYTQTFDIIREKK